MGAAKSVFQPFQPHHADLPPLAFTIREATPADAPALGLIAQERNGGELEPHVQAFERQIKRAVYDNDFLILVAEADGEIIAFAKAGFHHWRTPEVQGVPEGWYLLGVVVRPTYRRRGVARELTRKRLELLKTGCSAVYYFANPQNRVSIEMHQEFGFREITRDFSYPGVEFTGGVGILFRAEIGGRDEVVRELIATVRRWAQGRREILAVALVGSHARGEARPDSDIDLVVVVDDPELFISDHSWLDGFGPVEETSIENYGLVKSLRVFFLDGIEIEFGFTGRKWTEVPIDDGTLGVIRMGMKIVYDPEGGLKRMLDYIESDRRAQPGG